MSGLEENLASILLALYLGKKINNMVTTEPNSPTQSKECQSSYGNEKKKFSRRFQ